VQHDEREERQPSRAGQGLEVPARLDDWGVEEIDAYIATLRAEILRAESVLGKRRSQRDAADAVFRRS
jgi:uncharacterized small protein (DUF1192 family)